MGDYSDEGLLSQSGYLRYIGHAAAGQPTTVFHQAEFGHNQPLKFFLHTGHSSKRSCCRHTKCSSVRTIIAYADSPLEANVPVKARASAAGMCAPCLQH